MDIENINLHMSNENSKWMPESAPPLEALQAIPGKEKLQCYQIRSSSFSSLPSRHDYSKVIYMHLCRWEISNT